MTDNILSTIESLSIDGFVELYEIDLLPLGVNTQFYYTPSDVTGRTIVFNGISYLPLPIKITGFEKRSNELPPEPVLYFSNVDKGGYALLKQYDDMLGATITRRQTFARFLDFLDDGVTANPYADGTAQLLPEIWEINQKEVATNTEIRWRLRAAMDLQGKILPARIGLKNICMRRYRIRKEDDSGWTYPTVNPCPYTGSAMFTRANASTGDTMLDECSKSLKGCAARFTTEGLPGWFFPGINRLSQR